MITTGFDARVKVGQIIESQLPEFLLSESPKTVDFLKQYYLSQDFPGGAADIAENLDLYLKLDNLTPEAMSGYTTLTSSVGLNDSEIFVNSTKGFPPKNGLLKIDDEIITYTDSTATSFTGCVRGFSGVTSCRSALDQEELVFSTTSASTHTNSSKVENLSVCFLKEFYKKLKTSLTPGLENVEFVDGLDVSNFIKEARTFYQSKGTEESFRILFNVLFGETPKIINLDNLLLRPSSAQFLRREIVVAKNVSGNPLKLIGQTLYRENDEETKASISNVEILSRGGEIFYRIDLFLGFADSDSIQGTFTITPKTKVIGDVSVGSSIITVDSTIGFPESGSIVSGDNVISYDEKTVNQFLGCANITYPISTTDTIISEDLYFGYEEGNLSKICKIRITGVLSDFISKTKNQELNEGEKITVKNIGFAIKNPNENKTFKEIFANSWVYNTSVRYQIKTINGSSFTLFSTIDKSSLREGDLVDIIIRGSVNNVAFSNAKIANINYNNSQITLDNLIGFSPNSSLSYDLRRKLKRATSSATSIQYGNNILTSDVQNVYLDDEYFYVASNSLPSYQIDVEIPSSTIPNGEGGSSLQGLDLQTLLYHIISFPSSVPFITGDEVIYYPDSTPLEGLQSGASYFVKVDSTFTNKITLFSSRSFIETDDYLEFYALSPGVGGSHTFVLRSLKDRFIRPQKNLAKFLITGDNTNGLNEKTQPGKIGLIANGVDIINYKTDDKIYYGPVEKISLLNSGINYDVINPPTIELGSPNSGGINALVQPVVSGNVKGVLVDPQDFDIEKIISVTITGGNGSGCTLEPVLEKRYREIEFDARSTSDSGGVDVDLETISFLTNHNFKNGQQVVYNPNGNDPLGLGTYSGGNFNQNLSLVNGASYYVEVINNKTVQLYSRFDDYVSGINTVGFTTISAVGIHKFRIFDSQLTLKEIKVTNSGSGYQNRKLYIKPERVILTQDWITFDNHNFNDGDLVEYQCVGVGSTSISGLSTSHNYYILKVDTNKFRLADAGIGASITSNYDRRNYIKFSSQGAGYHIFKYPDVKLSVNVSYGSSIVGVITATPIVRGPIVDAYLYENGSKYGSETINLHKKPKIIVKNGKGAEFKPFIYDGSIRSVKVLVDGLEYNAPPDLVISGSGVGAILRANVSNGKVTSVVVINGGINYDENTVIRAASPGINALFDISIRPLTLNTEFRYGKEIITQSRNGLGYGWVGYSTSYGDSQFGDNGVTHSPIIGWAYDGNPIYGPYGYSDPEDNGSPVRLLRTGYSESGSFISDRPSSFDIGFFVEDYRFIGNQDLDTHNGRYCVTPDFPNGTYAYFAGIKTDTFNNLIPTFPYFIGDTYRSKVIEENFLNLDQNFDFNNSNLIRNTFPYKVNDETASCEFLYESNNISNQILVVDSVTSGSINQYSIIETGDGYSIGDNVRFDDTGTRGTGLNAVVSSITGKEIVSIAATTLEYENVIFTWKDKATVRAHLPVFHEFFGANNIITVSGLSTYVPKLTDTHLVGITSDYVNVIKEIPVNVTSGVVTDIYISRIPSSISIGCTVGVGSEFLSVLNIFSERNILRVKRGISGAAHTIGTKIYIKSNKLDIPLTLDYFDSEYNEPIYFNPKVSVGVGSTASNVNPINYPLGDISYPISVQTQSIYIPNHPFRTNQAVILSRPSLATTSLSVGTTSISPYFALPSAKSQTVYIINKSKDYIGLATQIGLTTTGGVFFFDNGADSYEYSLTPTKFEVIGDIINNKTTVALSTSHSLRKGDLINLSVKPESTQGIGNSSFVYLKYNSSYDKILVNPVGFSSESVDSYENTINLPLHGYKTGDKVFYDSSDLIVSGLETGSYYVYRIDDNIIQLSETLQDLKVNPIIVVGFANTGGKNQQLSLVNPPLNVYKNINLKFNVSDSSLTNYNLHFYTDDNRINEFVSVGTTDQFNIVKNGNFGSTGSFVTLNYSDEFPSKLFYELEKSGYISTSDTEVLNYSQIKYIDSIYSGPYNVTGVGNTTFDISLRSRPEKTSYTFNEGILKYTTNSVNDTGGVDKINIIFGGFGYKKTPSFLSVDSQNGRNANLSISGANIGDIREFKILDPGFEYASDKTLRPDALISPRLDLINNNEVSRVDIQFAGKKYTSSPELVLFNPLSKEIINSGTLRANVYSSSVRDVDVVEIPKGLNSVIHEIYTVNNSNGVGINSIITAGVGIVTIFLSTPFLGFSTAPFTAGDDIFVENIVLERPGLGFNSQDYDFKFFKVLTFENTIPAKLEYSIADVATGNPGLAKTEQLSFASITKKTDYPILVPVQQRSNFTIGERVSVISNSGIYIDTDLVVTDFRSNNVKLFGEYELKIGDIIRGLLSGTLATINESSENQGKFDVSYSLRRNFGWLDDVGKLNEDYQVIEDNDYYQNLSYSVKSTKSYDQLVDFVNRLVHPVGLKNFADTQVSTASSALVSGSGFDNIAVFDFVDEKRVDAVSSYDLVLDQDIITRDGKTFSKFIKFKSKKLSDYIECRSNRVLTLDNIGPQFSNANTAETGFTDLYTYAEPFARFLVQIKNTKTYETQFTEAIVLYTDSDVLIDGIKDANVFTIEKGTLSSNGDQKFVADVQGNVDQFDNLTLRIFPESIFTEDYDVKILVNQFNTTVAGISSALQIGATTLYAQNNQCGIKTSITIFEDNANKLQSFIACVHVLDKSNNEQNYAEIYVTHNGTDTYQSEFIADNNKYSTSVSSISIGTFTSSLESGVLKLNFANPRSSEQQIRHRIIGFGTESVGLGTYRFALEGQANERSARYVTNVVQSVGGASTSIVGVSTLLITSVKSYVNVSIGQTRAVHQLMTMHDGINPYIMQGPFLSIGSTSGIGSFTSEYVNDRMELIFHPDPSVTGICSIISFSEQLYTEIDAANIPPDLINGPINEKVILGEYNGSQGDRINRLDFSITYESIPVFSKIFNPENIDQLVLDTGTFRLISHFFSPNEEITYTEGSTFVGVPAIPMGIGATLVGGTVFTGDFLAGFSTITGVSTSLGLLPGQTVLGLGIAGGTTIVSIANTFRYFQGNVSTGSTIITGVANTLALNYVGAGIFSGNGTSLGTVHSVGIGSIIASTSLPVGTGVTYYLNVLGVGVSLSTVSSASSFRNSYTSGISTDICPSTLYVLKLDNDRFKVTGTRNSGIALTFTNDGSGNAHKLTMNKRLEKSLIMIDNVVQYPLTYTPINYSLVNNSGQISFASTIFGISGISSIRINDVLEVDNEFMKVVNFGQAPTASGPISGVGTYLVMNVERGFSGTIATEHFDGTEARIYRGGYNIADSTLYFTQAPLGSGFSRLDSSNLLRPYAKFDGRVYLRRDYSTNKIYDDISDQFSGIGATFKLTSSGQPTIGIEAGNSILFNNQIFQTPTTGNNAGNNYELEEVGANTNITYTGITSSDGSVVKSLVDVNQNQLPRGGIIISLGSTNGLGYAIPDGAAVGIVTGPNGAITKIVSSATTASYNTFTNFAYSHVTGIATITTLNAHDFVYGDQISIRNLKLECPDGYAGVTPNVAISTVVYNKTTGIMTVTTATPHYLASGVNFRLRNLKFDCPIGAGGTIGIVTAYYSKTTGILTVTTNYAHGLGIGGTVQLGDLQFSCSGPSGVTTTIFPDGTQGYFFPVNNVGFATEFTTNVGTSTITHNYQEGGFVRVGITTNLFPDGSRGYIFTTKKIINSTNFETNVGTSTITHNYISGGTVEVGITTNIFPDERGTPFTISNFDYYKTTGVSTITFNYNHNFRSNETIKLQNIKFDCPIGAGATIGITSVTYDNVTGIMTVSTAWNHLLTSGNTIRLFDLKFSCDSSGYGTTTIFPDGTQGYYFPVNNVGFATEFTTNVGTSTISHYYVNGGYVQVGITTSIFPDSDNNYKIVSIPSANSIVVNVGPSTITHNYVGDGYAYGKKRVGPYRVRTIINDNTFETDLYTVGFAHTYVSGGEVSKYYTFNAGSGYRGGEVGVYVTSLTGYGATIKAFTGIGGTLGFNIIGGGSGYAFTNTYISIPEPSYENLNVKGVSRIGIGSTTETGIGLLLTLDIDASQGEYGGTIGITSALYDKVTGIMTVTTDSVHNLNVGNHLQMYDLNFNCPIGAGATIGITSVTYDNVTGIMTVSTAWNHLQLVGNTIKLFDLKFSCDSSGYGTTTIFPDGSQGYYFPINSVGFATEFTTNVGTSTISHYYVNGGYVQVGITTSVFPDGTRGYDYVVNSVVGINTFAVNVGTSTITHNYINGGYIKPIGIGTETGEVRSFKIVRPGYAFQRGDVFTAVGLVTAKGLSQPIAPFELTVLDIFTDSFAAWQFGELDFIDSIKPMQDGNRTRFPLLYNGQLLSFEKNPGDPDSALIDLDSVLLIFINGVPQTPKTSYQFSGGTSFSFTSPPSAESDIAIFFYRGSRSIDSVFVNVNETVKKGDTVKIESNNTNRSTVAQNSRVVYEVSAADKIETNLYNEIGIDDINFKPLTWTKQKVDKFISGEVVYKTRDILESQIYPTAQIIKNVSSTDTELFIDKPELFRYEEDESSISIGEIDAFITTINEDPVAARLIASVSAGSTIQSVSVVNGGSGYNGSTIGISIAAPKQIGVGIGTTATATATIVNGSITSVVVDNPGFGYNASKLPQVLAPVATIPYEIITSINDVFGFSGIITGITTSTGVGGHPLALKFYLNANVSFAPLLVGYPINIFNTNVGSGVTSVDLDNNSIVGIGTSFLDNIYYIHSITFVGQNAEILTNVKSNSSIIGINTVGSATTNVGRFSWGRLTGFTRSSEPLAIGVTGFTVNPGLTTFPLIQRRGFGLRDMGGLRKILL